MRPLEPGQPQRRVRSLDGSRKGGLHRRREQDEDFRDLLDDALEGRNPEAPPREEDPVSWREEPLPTPDLDGMDRVEIRGRAASPDTGAGGDPEAAAGDTPARVPDSAPEAERAQPPAAAPPVHGGDRARLDLKA